MTTGYGPLRKQVKANRSGLLLGSNEVQDAQPSFCGLEFGDRLPAKLFCVDAL